MNNATINIEEILSQFSFEGSYLQHSPITNGHINSTFVLEFKNGEKIKRYLIQQINVNVFRKPDELMQNIVGVTSHLRKAIADRGGDPERETLTVYMTKDGNPYYLDDCGRYWRCYNFVEDTYTCEQIENPKIFYNAAKAFGEFQSMLADYPINSLYDTIPNFHNTVSRFSDFLKAVENDAVGRASSVKDEIEFALAREADAHVLVDLLNEGKLPLRVTHNDTKLNNVLFDNKTNEGICVVDLDTVMPGLSLYDFGDSIRFGANTATEDEKDLSKVSLDLELFEQYTRGYLSTAKDSLTENEINYLPFSAKLLTFECGIRFLGDYLNGDVYFRTAYPEHNLDRARTQLALVADIERKMDKMIAITQKICEEK